MPSQYPYRKTIRNEYLGVSKVIPAMTLHELDWLAEAQLAKWREQEARKRQQRQKEADREAARQQAENLKLQAEEDTRAAQDNLETFRTILRGSLGVNLAPDWEQLLDRRCVRPFQFSHPKPDRDQIRLQILGPKPTERQVASPAPEEPGFLESLLPFLGRRRLEREAEATELFESQKKRARAEFLSRLREYESREKEVVEAYNSAVRTYNAKLKHEREKYIQERDNFLAQQEAHNSAVLAFRSRYEVGSPEAVERYMLMVLERSSYPEPVAGEPDARFDEASNTLIVSFCLPGPADVPNIVEHKYVASRKAVKLVEMKQKEFEAFYDDVIHQIALRTMHELFVADYVGRAEAVVFNGWASGVDSKTGKPFTSCVLSCEASRKQFTDLDLAHVSPKECIRGLKGITAGPLVMLAPVKPIMELNRDDERFVESKEVLDHVRPADNLAAMEWEDFEHLVRELFESEFAQTGGEVRVTQASRDRGVDAIAFDPDPIRGGKFVIQAKRYNMVVPVSAVRDLYGTMIAEGATKGILVTTSHYGRDSREFAKDKPITLIDGENLVYMFQKHGRNVHIAMLPKGDPRRGSGATAGKGR
jgi:restriction system protein